MPVTRPDATDGHCCVVSALGTESATSLTPVLEFWQQVRRSEITVAPLPTCPLAQVFRAVPPSDATGLSPVPDPRHVINRVPGVAFSCSSV